MKTLETLYQEILASDELKKSLAKPGCSRQSAPILRIIT